MFKRILKWFGAIIAVVAIAIAVFLINLIWFRPWSLNLFYEKVFAEILFDRPEILSTLGLVEQFGITSHNGKLDDEAVAKLKELRSCTDELPAGYCQHGMLHLSFGVSYGVAVQKSLSKNED